LADNRAVLICQYRNCLANGSAEVLAAFQNNPVAGVQVAASGCLGQCNLGPSVQITPDGFWYCLVKPDDVKTIVEQHLKNGKPVTALLHPRFHPTLVSEGGSV
jgi:(2Fe-2S) ferredoxin